MPQTPRLKKPNDLWRGIAIAGIWIGIGILGFAIGSAAVLPSAFGLVATIIVLRGSS